MTLTRKITSEFTDEKIINGFRNNDPETIEKIYNELFPVINRLIEFNSGTPSDAKDIFQEALMVIYKKIENDEFILSCSFKTFLYSICRNLWFNQLRNRKG
ncbi:MAG: sigma factor, partial [Patescibacteria group bacterium]|nr:sigma factor [Patescibacteria group bacterium]